MAIVVLSRASIERRHRHATSPSDSRGPSDRAGPSSPLLRYHEPCNASTASAVSCASTCCMPLSLSQARGRLRPSVVVEGSGGEVGAFALVAPPLCGAVDSHIQGIPAWMPG
ncbi:hypothetical protein AB1Y20_012969 [Prymnesium parvum]|uniref:Uncharacterized protein n=1 Tax=Prymnesium parvum TaxID=97485 RepID=A0AB34IKC3_PRYPA